MYLRQAGLTRCVDQTTTPGKNMDDAMASYQVT